MSEKENGYSIGGNGQLTVKAPKAQPKTTGVTAIRGSDLRKGSK